MNWEKLFTMQKQLDTYIQQNHALVTSEIFDKKVLALLVEIGELANETRCFKFWSKKGPSEDTVILEEYVDGLHFILSLGIDLGFEPERVDIPNIQADTTELFHQVYQSIQVFKEKTNTETYQQLFGLFLRLGQVLGFSETAIMQAYIDKNETNFNRQDQNY
ncbi:dUTPase [Paraliobacillus sp. PM-2]|uniref:dUTP diphosphatase n=1 Tax=Paraliobacillus sp. PM-2 TaxID=1462524 RepID=UPI00061CB5E2|nr:dUTP diphosphatase [Paraliobacillus sp. PM-2]CQR48087.1 dUTPase [Paraliobacillus sp. PM-2]